jgi:hypothetical protein
LGEPRKAIEYEQALLIEIGDRRGEGTALWNTALALEELGDREAAIGCAAAALTIRTKPSNRPTRRKGARAIGGMAVWK